jgi:hypothetical protein
MPNKLILPREEKDDWGYDPDEGIKIVWTPTANRLDISGWYDSYAAIESTSMTLGEFFSRLGITETDCKKAFKDNENGQENA